MTASAVASVLVGIPKSSVIVDPLAIGSGRRVGHDDVVRLAAGRARKNVTNFSSWRA